MNDFIAQNGLLALQPELLLAGAAIVLLMLGVAVYIVVAAVGFLVSRRGDAQPAVVMKGFSVLTSTACTSISALAVSGVRPSNRAERSARPCPSLVAAASSA